MNMRHVISQGGNERQRAIHCNTTITKTYISSYLSNNEQEISEN